MVRIKSNNPKLTLKELVTFESKNNVNFPNDYKEFLLEHNGGYPDKSIFKIRGNEEQYESILNVFYGVGDMYDNLQKILIFSDELLDVGFVPIADDSGGNQICIGVSKENFGDLYFWEHELGNENELDNLFFISSSFQLFLHALYD
ncbi:SMI1/KNR4 family protein [Oceanobacillus jeddahense]|uniref:SMI1/KNR4 family protein n=1 Tax=Oceanobacillus jeddahense TaxID=1462527 RepID=A0ABY5JW52_9BACI|nr:SMI1/KNR4 family protein [Oceanobacillus jeddahense]UUI02799.1 SMI1/KNR4 family protein [Oceanobacillus jeddahense]